jgi:hypothetical protein
MSYKFNPFTGNLDLVDTTAAAGSDTQVQYNDGGSLAGSADLTWDDTGKELGVGGDINLDGRFISSLNGAASEPAGTFTGTWFTGGTATTTKPQVLIEPTGTTSTAWSTSGTGLGVNAASGFSGRLLDLQTNGTSQMVVQGDGKLGLGTTSPVFKFHSNETTGSSIAGLFQTDQTESFISFAASGTTATSTVRLGATGDDLIAFVNGGERMRIDSSGRLLVGTSSSRDLIGASYSLQIEGSGTSPYSGLSILNKANNAVPAYLILSKSRGGTNGVDAVSDASGGDAIGDIWFAAADGTDLASASARITCFVDGAVSGDDVPGRLVFSTTADGSSSPTERMRIRANGVINFSSCPTYADDAAAGTGGLVAGDIYKTSTGELRIKL